MILLNAHSTLVLIITINLFIHANAEDKGRSSKVQNLINDLTSTCNTIENIPETICKKSIVALESEIKKGCQKAVKLVCDALPWFLHILISAESCTEDLNKYICGTLDKAERTVMGFVENECTEELEKIFIGHGCDADGNKVSICDGLPTTVDGICTMAVDAVCEELPSILHTFTPFCQESLDSLICRDILDAVNPTIFNYDTPDSAAFWVGVQ